MKISDTVIVLINEAEVKAEVTSLDSIMQLVFVTVETPINGETHFAVNADQVIKTVE